MSFETLIADLINALNANTAAHKGSSNTAAAPAKDSKAAPAGKTKPAAKSGVTFEKMSAALTKLKEDFGAAEAKKILSDNDVGKMAETPEAKYQTVYDEAVARHTELSADSSDDDGI
jgi:hypothetical protein